MPLRGEGSCGGGGAPRDSAGSGATEEGLTSRGGRKLRLPLRFGLRPQGPCRVGTGESGLVLSEEGNPAGLSSCSGGLRPLVELCVEPAGLCGRCTGVAVPLRVVPSPPGLPSKRGPGNGPLKHSSCRNDAQFLRGNHPPSPAAECLIGHPKLCTWQLDYLTRLIQ